MYDLYQRGLFGNRLKDWPTPWACLDDPNRPSIVGIRYRGLVKNAPCIPHISIDQLENVVARLSLDGWEPSRMLTCESFPNHARTIQGEVCRSENFYDLRYSDVQLMMRDAFRIETKYARGLEAKILLEHYMDPASYDDLMDIFEMYDSATVDPYDNSVAVEFTCLNTDIGVCPGRNTLIWEVRHDY